jgi:hypothetical protein
LFVGAVVLTCLIKPLFARPVRGNKPVKLDLAAPSLLAPAAAGPISESKAEAVANREAYVLFFRSPLEWRPLPLPGRLPDLPPDPRQMVSELTEDRLAAAQAQEEHGCTVRIYQAAERRLIKAWRVESLLAAGFSIDPAALKELSDLHRRVLGRLINTAEAVEQALGFTP